MFEHQLRMMNEIIFHHGPKMLQHSNMYRILILCISCTMFYTIPFFTNCRALHHVSSLTYWFLVLRFWCLLTAPSGCYTPVAVPSQHICLCKFISCIKDCSFLINTSPSMSLKFYSNSSEPVILIWCSGECALWKILIIKPTRCHFCILYFSSNSCSTCFRQPCAHHQELMTVWCYSLVLVCAVTICGFI